MGARCRWVFSILIVLLSDLLQFVLAIAVIRVLLLLSFARHPVLSQALQFPERAFGSCAARLDILQDSLVYLVAHAQQLAPRWYL